MTNPAVAYATIATLLGILLLFAWLYAIVAFLGWKRIVGRSLLIFTLPIIAGSFLPRQWLIFPLAFFAFVLVEELLKVLASRTEAPGMTRFWLVASFGIWEMTIAKPVWGLTSGAIAGDWTPTQVVGLATIGLLPVLMHSVTAAFYAFRLTRWPVVQLLVCVLLHATFNMIVTAFPGSIGAAAFLTIVLLLILYDVWPASEPSSRQGGMTAHTPE